MNRRLPHGGSGREGLREIWAITNVAVSLKHEKKVWRIAVFFGSKDEKKRWGRDKKLNLVRYEKGE